MPYVFIPRRKPPRAYTDNAGYKTADAPKNWPFGRSKPIVFKAKPLMKRKAQDENH